MRFPLLLAAALCLGTHDAGGAPNPRDHVQAAPGPPCREIPEYGWLDFWVGEWTVWVGETRVGTSRIEAIVDGCAILEHWRDARGSEGKSLFYISPSDGSWRQVWVTGRAAAQGGVREKRLVARYPDGGVRFQGEVAGAGGPALDRTTLSPGPNGSVRQVIEVSRDGGTSWTTGFDAEYRRAAARQ